MNDIVSIDSTVETDGVVYYQIRMDLPLRSYIIKRRYNEFEQLAILLAKDLGIDVKDLPYQLPVKRWFKRTDNIIEERKLELANFLNSLIKHSEFQNNKLLIRFLQLPPNMKFRKEMFQNKASSVISTAPDVIDESEWLEVFRTLKSQTADLSSVSDKFQVRETINRTLQPALKNLQSSLARLASNLSKTELQRRQSMLKEISYNFDNLLIDKSQLMPLKPIKRIFGSDMAKETKDTINLSVQELIQQQVQVHQQQDQEVEQLRHLISKQRQLGELINTEVEEQNAMLDDFHNQLDTTADKLNIARQRAKKITQ